MLTQDDLLKISDLFKEEINPIKTNLDELRQDFQKQSKDIKQIKKSLDTEIDYFDKNDIKSNRELDKIKKHIGLSSEKF